MSIFQSIFEEQHIVKSLDVFSMQRGVFAEDQRVFSFGTVLARSKVFTPTTLVSVVILFHLLFLFWQTVL